MTIEYKIGDANILFKEIADESIDLIVTDPDYGVGKYDGDVLELEWLKEARRVLKHTGSLYFFGSVWRIPVAQVEAMRLGFIPQNTCIWYYENAMARQSRNWQFQYDPIAYFTKSEDFTFNIDSVREPYKSQDRLKHPIKKDGKTWIPNPLGRKCGNVWDIPALCGANYADERTIHPTQKPKRLIEKIVRASSSEGDTVLDPFLGSGTTLVVCASLHRNAIGFEINPKYESVIISRLDSIQEAII